RMLGGDPPGTFQVHAGQELIGTWVIARRMEDLTFLFEEQGWFDVFPAGLIDLISTEEGVWSVPVNIHRSNVMWYIPENLERWGVSVPKTWEDRKSTRLNSSHVKISYAVFCLKKKNKLTHRTTIRYSSSMQL